MREEEAGVGRRTPSAPRSPAGKEEGEKQEHSLAGRKRRLQRPRDSGAVTTNRAAGEMGGHSPCAQYTGAERQALPLRGLAVLLLQGWPRPSRVEND